jgi:hypothetical protein
VRFGFLILGLVISGFLGLGITAILIGSPLATVGAALSDINLPGLETQKHTMKPWGRDPFATAPAKSKGLSGGASGPGEGGETGDPHSSLNLSAIIKGEGEGEGVAIINGEIVRKGDQLGDKKVREIRGDRVIIQDRFGTVELKINTLTVGYEPASQGRESSGKRPDKDQIADGP